MAWHLARVSTASRARIRFQFRTNIIESSIRKRLATYEQLLQGLAGLYASSGDVTRDGFDRYLMAVRPEATTPIGFTLRVLPSERRELERRVQGERVPLTIWPSSTRDELYPVLYVYPSIRSIRPTRGSSDTTRSPILSGVRR